MYQYNWARIAWLVVIVGGLLAFAGERSWEARKWKQIADQRGFVAERAALYLFGETEVLDAKKHPMRRVDILDALIANAVERQNQK